MYFFHVLFLAKTIKEIPQLFHIWSNPKLDSSMYRKDILRDWPSFHLQHYGWYLDYSLDSIPIFERSLKEMFDPRFMDKLTSNETNKNEKIKKRRKKKKLTEDPPIQGTDL
jgi:hypothetical protein